jgi:hypothetical protein
MRKPLIIIAVIALIVVIAGGYMAYTYLTPQNQGKISEIGTSPKVLSTVDEIRDGAMVYIGANQTGTVSLMKDLSWTGGRQDTGLLGAETYVYTSGSWSVVIDYPVVLNPIFTITADYAGHGTSVNWVGTYQNQTFCETRAIVQGVSSTIDQQQIRDLTMMYLKVYHNDTATYMQSMSWTGGRMDMGMMVGSDKYNYHSNGWNITIQNPVVPNPPYTITSIYTPTNMHTAMMTWIGTLENGTITQTNYVYSP